MRVYSELIIISADIKCKRFLALERPPYNAAKSLQSCLTLCDPIEGSPPGSAILGILQARTLEWIVIDSYKLLLYKEIYTHFPLLLMLPESW